MPVYTLTRRGGRTKRDLLISLRAVRGLYIQAGSLQLPLFFKLLANMSPSGEPVVPVNEKTYHLRYTLTNAVAKGYFHKPIGYC